MVEPVLDLNATGDDGFVPPPVIRRSTILAIGFAMFFLALIWPPMILMVTYILSILVPVSIMSITCAFQSLCTLFNVTLFSRHQYSWRVNDDPTSRRRLFKEFRERADLPAAYRLTDEEVVVDERYWVNER